MKSPRHSPPASDLFRSPFTLVCLPKSANGPLYQSAPTLQAAGKLRQEILASGLFETVIVLQYVIAD